MHAHMQSKLLCTSFYENENTFISTKHELSKTHTNCKAIFGGDWPYPFRNINPKIRWIIATVILWNKSLYSSARTKRTLTHSCIQAIRTSFLLLSFVFPLVFFSPVVRLVLFLYPFSLSVSSLLFVTMFLSPLGCRVLVYSFCLAAFHSPKFIDLRWRYTIYFLLADQAKNLTRRLFIVIAS